MSIYSREGKTVGEYSVLLSLIIVFSIRRLYSIRYILGSGTGRRGEYPPRLKAFLKRIQEAGYERRQNESS